MQFQLAFTPTQSNFTQLNMKRIELEDLRAALCPKTEISITSGDQKQKEEGRAIWHT